MGGVADWQRDLNAAEIPASVVQTLAEAVGHEQVAHRGLLHEVGSPDGSITVLGSPFALDRGVGPARSVPALGEHSEEILAGLGYDGDAVAALRAGGAV